MRPGVRTPAHRAHRKIALRLDDTKRVSSTELSVGHPKRKRGCQMASAFARRFAVLGAAFAIAAALGMVSAPSQAVAGELQSSGLLVQSSENYLPATAETLVLGKHVSGEFVDYRKDAGGGYIGSGALNALEHHWFKFKTTGRDSVYKVRIESLSGDSIGFHRYDSDVSGYWMDGTGVSSTSTTYTSTLDDLDRKATYYVELDAAGGSAYNYAKRYAKYRLTVTEYPVLYKATGLKAPRKAKTSLTVKWSKQANATKYQVKYREKGGSWKTVTATGNSAKLKGLKAGKAYQVKVRSYRKGGYFVDKDHTNFYERELNGSKVSNWGAWSDVKTVKTLG